MTPKALVVVHCTEVICGNEIYVVNKLVEIPHGDKKDCCTTGKGRGHTKKTARERIVISLQSFFVCSDIFTNTAAVTLYHSW